MTNFDKLKEMPLEKVASIISATCNGCVIKDCKLHNHGSYWCTERFIKWLKSQVKDND